MPQYQKEEVRDAILSTAKQEFLRKGFRDANLREISRKAKVPVGNLYNYFDDKNQLFEEVLRPQIEAIKKALQAGKAHGAESSDAPTHSSAWPLAEDVSHGVSYVIAHRAELDLLINQARGSSLEDFLEQIATDYQRICIEYFEGLARSNPQRRIQRPSEFFLHSLSHFYIKAVAEMLDHELSDSELREQVEELLNFSWNGLAALLEPPKSKDVPAKGGKS
ncbi:MAG: TetR/AcrR family transcriptional regulator [Oligoflexia bacterium]|nr:TetR/AcrR family transcriptional regulator [Oligoflexia bacterium]